MVYLNADHFGVAYPKLLFERRGLLGELTHVPAATMDTYMRRGFTLRLFTNQWDDRADEDLCAADHSTSTLGSDGEPFLGEVSHDMATQRRSHSESFNWDDYVVYRTDLLVPPNIPPAMDHRIRKLIDFEFVPNNWYALSRIPKNFEWDVLDDDHTETILAADGRPITVFVTGVLTSHSIYVGPNNVFPSMRIGVELLREADCDAVWSVHRSAYGAGTSVASMPAPLNQNLFRAVTEGGNNGLQGIRRDEQVCRTFEDAEDLRLLATQR
ncbi:hypothetical protein TRAPUB_4917 [Trametes pubescens]|uniref:Uncharacterized protein n=1 Tax=Trametes pubescens TaxID=154538 RepID=A0A1M2V9T9_TRAPU|nr:hypothetical protein TRAPUB_4917 [Trametes pubescens]